MSQKSTAQIIKDCGGTDSVASSLNVSVFTVCDWISNNKIPAKHWQRLTTSHKVDIKDLLALTNS
jgi:hypothetical protein